MKDRGGGGREVILVMVLRLLALGNIVLIVADTTISKASFQVPEKQNYLCMIGYLPAS